MKISEASGHMPSEMKSKKSAAKSRSGRAGAGAVGPAAPAAFVEALSESGRTKIKMDLDELMISLNQQGERLLRSQNFEELEKYKNLVAGFLDKVVNELYRLQAAGHQDPRQRVHVILQKVDLQIEALAKDVLSRQTPALRIMEKLDEIRGLLLDLYK